MRRRVDSDDLDVELDWQSPVPPFTQWNTKCKFCGLSWNYVPALKQHFVNHWECHCVMPTLVLTIIYSSLLVYFICQRRPLPDIFGWKMTVYLTFTAILFGYSYILTILTGPGYLPYYFPLRNPNDSGDSCDSLSGMVTSEEQLFYVKNIKLPRRTGYFKSTRRVVIRPDHFCGWTTSFIGKKNHKLFFLFNFWGLCYICPFTICSIIAAVNLGPDEKRIPEMIFCIIYAILGFMFGMMTGSFAFSMCCEFSENVTTLETMKGARKGKPRKRRNPCLDNWEEVFGPASKMYMWLIPTPAFDVADDSLLIEPEDMWDETDAFL